MSWIQRVLYGVDLDETQAALDATNAALAAENERDRAKYGDKWFEEAQANLTANQAEESDVSGAVDQAFDEGLQEGADNVTSVISKPFQIVGAAVGSILKALPWWLWLAIIIAGAAYFRPLWAPLLKARR